MDRAIAARIQEWDTRPLTAGYAGLRELSDANFSGAVTTGTAWLFMLNGRIVGLVDGTMATFEDTQATAHEAPDPALPLLFAMQEHGGETQAKYYTDDNPLPEVHRTLSDAGFTGYIELSENVLSGDYYVVYYGGKSMSAAFVGNAERLVTGDEAFELAADEVGIYEVRDVDLEVRTVPEPADEPGDAGATAGAADPGGASAGPGQASGTTPPAGEPTGEPGTEVPADPAVDPPADPAAEPPADPAEPPADPAAEPPAEAPSEAPAEPSGGQSADEAAPAAEPGTEPDADDPFTQEEAWREARTIPALDPEETAGRDQPAAGNGGEAVETAGGQPGAPEASTETPAQPPSTDAELQELRSTIQQLQAELEATRGDAETDRARREQLERELEAARSAEASADVGAADVGAADVGAADAPQGTRPIGRAEALEQTDLFVRYGTKGGGTLEKAHDGILAREEVVENLRIEHHTRFETEAVSVEGQPFGAFLDGSLEYQFVDWLVTRLLFEIQDTGSQRGLRDLFDAIPRIDRVEFHGTVDLPAEGEEDATRSFDVVCRNRMGQPLVVANLNDVRDPATGEMMTGLIDGASAVAEAHETLGGAFMVTSSFFQPDALETASEATGGGLLAREKRWSYVKRGRRQGYHLCLVEARGENFHVAVPEL